MTRQADPIALVPRTSEHKESVQACIDAMQALVDEGEITGIAIATVGVDGSTRTNYTQGFNAMTLVGALNYLAYRINSDIYSAPDMPEE